MKDILYKTERVYYDQLFDQLYVVTDLYCKEAGVRYRYIKMESPLSVTPDMIATSHSWYFDDCCVFMGDL
jgi:hypothetical protein